MTGKERAQLRKSANTLTPIFQIGKGDINDNMVAAVDSTLEKRELIKLSILETANISPKEASDTLAAATHAEVIQCIGRKFVLYRKNPEKDQQ